MKFLLVVIIMALFNIIILQTDPPVNEWAQIIMAIGSVLGILITAASPFLIIYFNKKMSTVTTTMNTVTATTQDTNDKVTAVASKVDGLLDKKALADEALGKIKGLEEAAREEGIANKREVEMRREQDLKDQPSTKNPDNTDVKNLEMEIRKKGDEIQKVVEKKGEDIQKGVEEVPDKVIEKLPPK